MPALTVLLPVRDGERHLDAALTSIGTQTVGDFELLVVDDHSTDGTAAILAAHAASDSRIRVLRNRGRGLVDGLNFGLAQAETELVARMDADDVALPERFERQLALLAVRPELVALGTGAVTMDDAGGPVGLIAPPTEHEAIAALLARVNPMAHPTVILRRSAVQAAGGYRRAYLRAEDYDLWLRLAETGRLANLAEPLLRYRLPSGFDAARFARQVSSEMTARAAAALRRAGRPDPTGNWKDIDPANLADLGIDGDLRREVARRALQAARDFRRAGDGDAFRAALALADAQPGTGLGDRLRYALRRMKAVA